MSTGPTINRGGSKQNYRTPDDFRAAVVKRFGCVKFDLAAEPDNTFTPGLFFSKEQNSLVQEWNKIDGDGWLWLNPEFADIEPWAAKCAAEMELGARILLLTPASVGSNWFKQWVQPSAAVIPLNGRLSFDGKDPYPRDLMLSVYCAGLVGFQPAWRWST